MLPNLTKTAAARQGLASVQWSERKGNKFGLEQRGVLHAGETKREGEAGQGGERKSCRQKEKKKKMGGNGAVTGRKERERERERGR
jgi:hypothetical protein